MGKRRMIIVKELSKKQNIIKCPNCLNCINLETCNNGASKGTCKVCKTIVFAKKHNNKETYMKIIRQ